MREEDKVANYYGSAREAEERETLIESKKTVRKNAEGIACCSCLTWLGAYFNKAPSLSIRARATLYITKRE